MCSKTIIIFFVFVYFFCFYLFAHCKIIVCFFLVVNQRFFSFSERNAVFHLHVVGKEVIKFSWTRVSSFIDCKSVFQISVVPIFVVFLCIFVFFFPASWWTVVPRLECMWKKKQLLWLLLKWVLFCCGCCLSTLSLFLCLFDFWSKMIRFWCWERRRAQRFLIHFDEQNNSKKFW